MLEVRENEIAMRQWSGGAAHFRSCATWRGHWPWPTSCCALLFDTAFATREWDEENQCL